MLASLLLLPCVLQAACPGLEGESLRWVVPNRPGGGYDAYSRLLQPFLEREWGVRIRIENRPAAGGTVGASLVRDADADGRTLGLINASGLIAANAVRIGAAPDPARDFLILGSVVSNHVVLFSGRDSGIESVEDLLVIARERPIVAGVRDAGSSSFYAVPVAAELMGFEYELVTGYVGSSARALAAMRGEVDIVIGHYDSVEGQVEAGELRPLLRLTAGISGAPEVPLLAGPDGVASRLAAMTGRAPAEAAEEAAALAIIVGAGRLVVAPLGLPEPLAACLGDGLARVLAGPELAAAAARAELGIEPLDAETALAQVRLAEQAVVRFEGLVRAAVEQSRR